MPGRKYTSGSSYRFGFNGEENDNDVKNVEGGQQDYGMRIYDPRAGKFLSIDPLTKSYPQLTPYQFAGNNPIAGIDLDGGEFYWYVYEWLEKKMFGTTHLKKVRQGATEQAVKDVKGIGQFLKQAYKEVTDKNNLPVMGGINPKRALQENKSLQGTVNEIVGAGKAVLDEYGTLVKKASKGDEKAIGALGFEVLMFAVPGGEEAKGLSTIPKGFKSAEQFVKVGEEFAVALEKSGIKFEEIGVQGSSVTGKSWRTGNPFRWGGKKPSDIDAFVILKEDIPLTGGKARPDFIHPDKLLERYPALREWSEKWSKILGRDITPAAFKPKKK